MGKKPPKLPRGVAGHKIGTRHGGGGRKGKGCALVLIMALGTLLVAAGAVWRMVA